MKQQFTFIEMTTDGHKDSFTFWYKVGQECYGVEIYTGIDYELLDSDGSPVEECDDHNDIMGLLLSDAKYRYEALERAFEPGEDECRQYWRESTNN